MKWAGLQFPNFISIDALAPRGANFTGPDFPGAVKYVDAIGASAESLFVSSIVVQVIATTILLTLHLGLLHLISKKLKTEPPAELALPKFELGYFLAMFESILTTTIVTWSAHSAAWSKALAVIAFLSISGYALYLAVRMQRMLKAGAMTWEDEDGEVKSMSRVQRLCVVPAKVFVLKWINASEPPHKFKGKWAASEAKHEKFCAGYSELYSGYTGENAMFFAWLLAEQWLRVLFLALLPGKGQTIVLFLLSLASLVLLCYRMPYAERNLNYSHIFSKLIEVYTFFHFVTVTWDSAHLDAAASAIEQVNMIGIYVGMAFALLDTFAMAKNVILAKRAKKTTNETTTKSADEEQLAKTSQRKKEAAEALQSV
jgi:hypothetical protein